MSEHTLVILIHGLFADRTVGVIPLLEARLSEHEQVFSFDLPGHGESDTPLQGLEDFDAALNATIDAALDRSRAKRVVLIGHSLGGVLAYRAAARRSDVAGLVLLAPGFTVTSRLLLELEERAMSEGNVTFSWEGREYTLVREFFETRRFDPVELAPLIEQPTVIIVGAYDYTISQHACESLAHALAHGSFYRVPGEGHALTGLAYWPLIRSFLDDLQARGI